MLARGAIHVVVFSRQFLMNFGEFFVPSNGSDIVGQYWEQLSGDSKSVSRPYRRLQTAGR
jgi:hypothetical protein